MIAGKLTGSAWVRIRLTVNRYDQAFPDGRISNLPRMVQICVCRVQTSQVFSLTNSGMFLNLLHRLQPILSWYMFWPSGRFDFGYAKKINILMQSDCTALIYKALTVDICIVSERLTPRLSIAPVYKA